MSEKLKPEYIFCSVRVSNELGASHPRTAKFSLVVAVITSFLIGVIISVILILTRNVYPSLFSSNATMQVLKLSLKSLHQYWLFASLLTMFNLFSLVRNLEFLAKNFWSFVL